MSKTKTITMDVREDIQRGREPFGKIMEAVGALGTDQELVLIAPFEPVPLYGVLAQYGLAPIAKPLAGGDWEVRFTRDGSASAGSGTTKGTAGHSACTGVPVVNVDARGLEPPQPMVKILEALASLPEGARLRAQTDRRPMHLIPQVEERGFVANSEEQSDGSFVTEIRRR